MDTTPRLEYMCSYMNSRPLLNEIVNSGLSMDGDIDM